MQRGSEPPPAPNSQTPSRGVRRVIAVGGGRGGVGKSVVAANLSVYLAQLGRSVVLVDADPVGAELHTLLDLEAPAAEPVADGDDEADLVSVPTAVPGLRLLPQT